MQRVLLILICFFIGSIASGQGKFFTKTGSISFFSKTQLEDIDAHNRSVTCVLDTKTGNVQFSVLMKGFEFKKALMQEHFNEDYIESDKYPRAEFKGQIDNNSSIDYSKEAANQVRVKGPLTIHGQTNDLETDGTLTVKEGKIFITCEFKVEIADYKISVAAFAKNKVAKTISVKVSCVLEQLK
ncbi:MAG: YceI family protein [Chitinophagaceae bacterium]|nr:YceI family protein [Chitinophagaceae bacterium]